MANCEGTCEPHSSPVVRVRVVDPSSGKDWGEFWYCGEAVGEDERRGFVVTPSRFVAPEVA
jgi:hypothetical protein